MLDKNTLRTILADWNYWHSPPPPSIPRRVLETKWRWDKELVMVIQGVRRCGKSTLLTQILTQQRLDPQSCYFINFEDPRFAEDLDSTLLDLLVALATEERKNRSLYFFLDEIQSVENWEKWLHTQVERPKNNYFVVTGSNASLLGGKMSTALTGRHRTLELFPFDFLEFQRATGDHGLDHYLERGGFPKALAIDDGGQLLREYFADIIERDARRQLATRSPQTLPLVAKAIFESLGTEVSLRKLAHIFDSTADSLRTYVSALASSYLVLECPFFSYSERRRLVRPSKYYPIDTGLHRAIITRSGANTGRYLETAVFHWLKRKFKDVFHWQGKSEIDFVVQDGKCLLSFQVTWDKPKERHENAMLEFQKEFPRSGQTTVITRENARDFLG